jgi:hypothetical protein
VETAVSEEDNREISSSSLSDIYFPPREGFTFQDLLEATNNFNEGFVIGKGAVGTVYKAVMQTGLIIAVKKLASHREGNNTSIEDSFRAEILTLGNIRHKNIVKLYGFCYHRGSNLLLYEYLGRGSLGDLLTVHLVIWNGSTGSESHLGQRRVLHICTMIVNQELFIAISNRITFYSMIISRRMSVILVWLKLSICLSRNPCLLLLDHMDTLLLNTLIQ